MMIFVDSNVFIYAVGRPHPLKAEGQTFFLEASQKGKRLVTSAGVLQELLHVYLPVGRFERLLMQPSNWLHRGLIRYYRSLLKRFCMPET